MIAPKHSPEPWRIVSPDRGKGERWSPGIDDENGDAVIWEGAETADADLRRIVACVNACAGVSTEELEALKPGDVASALGMLP